MQCGPHAGQPHQHHAARRLHALPRRLWHRAGHQLVAPKWCQVREGPVVVHMACGTPPFFLLAAAASAAQCAISGAAAAGCPLQWPARSLHTALLCASISLRSAAGGDEAQEGDAATKVPIPPDAPAPSFLPMFPWCAWAMLRCAVLCCMACSVAGEFTKQPQRHVLF